MSDVIQFTVFAKPQSAGSKRAFAIRDRRTGDIRRRGNGSLMINVVDDNPKAADWKRYVAAIAMNFRPRQLLTGPLKVSFVLFRRRPKSHFNSRGELNKKGRAMPFPIAKPDVLKLARGVEDSLTGVIWRDDAQIVDEVLKKRFGDEPCCFVRIEAASPAQLFSAELS